MALIKCPECGKEISDRSKACVHCGFPLDEYTPEPIESVPRVSVIEEPLPVKENASSMPVVETAKTEEPKPSSESNAEVTPNRSLKYVIIAVIVIAIGWFAVNNLVLLPNKYEAAEQLLESGKYTDAIAAFEELGSFNNAEKDKEYAIALAEYYAEEYEAALEHFEALDDHRNSRAYFDSIVYKPVYSELDSDGKEYTINWSYDDAGRLEYFVESSEEEKTGPDRGKIVWQLRRTYKYDSTGNVTTMVEQTYFYEELSGTATYTYTYSFNTDGSIKERQCVYKSDSKTTRSTTTYEYGEEGRVVREHYQSNTSSYDMEYEYDYRGLVSKETYTKENGYTEVHDYSYDRYGNLDRDSYTFGNVNSDGELTECVQKYWHQRYEVVAVNEPVL